MPNNAVTIQLVIYFANICLAIFDKASHFLYYFDQKISTEYIRTMILFFLLASPIVQVISWSIIIGQISIGGKFSDDAQVKTAQTIVQYYKLLVIRGTLFNLRLAFHVLKSIPIAIVITLMQESKMFPFVLFGYSYFKYRAIVTKTIMNNIAPLIQEQKKVKARQKKSLSVLIQNLSTIQKKKLQINHAQVIEMNKKVNNNDNEEGKEYLENQDNDKLNSEGNSPRMNMSLSVDKKSSLMMNLLNKNQEFKPNKQFSAQQFNDVFKKIAVPIEQTTQENKEISKDNMVDMCLYEMVKGVVVGERDKSPKKNVKNQLSLRTKKRRRSVEAKKAVGIFKQVVQQIQAEDVADTEKNQNNNFFDNSSTYEAKDKDMEFTNSNNVDLALDANCSPSLELLVFDKNLSKFLQITNVIQAFFESLPLAILQYINNEQGNNWYDSNGTFNYLVVFSFISSAFMILQFGVQLMQLLYGRNISIFYSTLDYLNSQETSNSESEQTPVESTSASPAKGPTKQPNSSEKLRSCDLGKLFPMPSRIVIEKINQLYKIDRVSQTALNRITSLSINLPDNFMQIDNILDMAHSIIPKHNNLEEIYFNFTNNQMKDSNKLLSLITKALKLPRLQTFSLKMMKNLTSSSFSSDISYLVQKWELDKQQAGIDVNKVIIDDYQTIIGVRNEQLMEEKYQIYSQLILEKNSIGKNKFYFQINQSLSLKGLATALNYIEEQIPFLQSVQIIVSSFTDDLKPMKELTEKFKTSSKIQQFFIGSQKNGILDFKGMDLETTTSDFSFVKSYFDLQLDSMDIIMKKGKEIQATLENISLDFSPQIVETCFYDKNQRNDNVIANSINSIRCDFPNLKGLSLVLRDCILNSRFMNSFTDFLQQLPELSYLTLDLSMCSIKKSSLSQILKEIDGVKSRLTKFEINLSGFCLEKGELKKLNGMINSMDNLTHLSLRLNGVPLDFKDSSILQIKIDSLLELSVSLWENTKEEEGKNNHLYSFLDGALEYQNKIYIGLKKNYLRDDHLEMVMQKLGGQDQVSYVKELSLDYESNLIQGDGVSTLQQSISSLHNLQYLSINLNHNQVNNYLCMGILRGALQLFQLSKLELDFGYNNITDEAGVDWMESLNYFPMLNNFVLNFEQNTLLGKITPTTDEQYNITYYNLIQFYIIWLFDRWNQLGNQFIQSFCDVLTILNKFQAYQISINSNQFEYEILRKKIITSGLVQNNDKYIRFT